MAISLSSTATSVITAVVAFAFYWCFFGCSLSPTSSYRLNFAPCVCTKARKIDLRAQYVQRAFFNRNQEARYLVVPLLYEYCCCCVLCVLCLLAVSQNTPSGNIPSSHKFVYSLGSRRPLCCLLRSAGDSHPGLLPPRSFAGNQRGTLPQRVDGPVKRYSSCR